MLYTTGSDQQREVSTFFRLRQIWSERTEMNKKEHSFGRRSGNSCKFVNMSQLAGHAEAWCKHVSVLLGESLLGYIKKTVWDFFLRRCHLRNEWCNDWRDRMLLLNRKLIISFAHKKLSFINIKIESVILVEISYSYIKYIVYLKIR